LATNQGVGSSNLSGRAILLILVAFFRQSRLLVARVKIDGSFVRDVQTNRRSQATVQAIVQLAKSIGADTVGETVETLEAADKLRQLSVDRAQGYAFGRPEPLEGVLDQLLKLEERSGEL
jgi:EAL domain-containing protein (putative c-di-GMP-specific phosphodiesterase class I)